MASITNFINKFKMAMAEINNVFLKRYNKSDDGNKLDFKNTLYASILALNNKGIEEVSSDLNLQSITNVSKNAIIKVRNTVKTFTSIQKINNNLIDIIYDPENDFIKPYNFTLCNKKNSYLESKTSINKKLFINTTSKRFVGCDGMQVNVNKSLINNDDVKSSKSGNYGIVLISSLFDIMNKIPINYSPTKSTETNFNKKKVNETTGLLDQLHLLNSNDVLVLDNWYFSKNLQKTFVDNDIGYIFRMKKNSKYFSGMKFGTSKIITINKQPVQLFKYKIKKHEYYILTSITEKITIAEIKALYWRRWKIETDNKKFKYDILSSDIRSKNYNSLLADIESIRFMSIISSIIEYLGKDDLEFKKKFHTTNCIHILYAKLLNLIFYSNDEKEILRVLNIIYIKIIDIIGNRSCKRKRVKPTSKWNANGNKYGNKKES